MVRAAVRKTVTLCGEHCRFESYPTDYKFVDLCYILCNNIYKSMNCEDFDMNNFQDYCLGVLGCVFGFCLMGTAFLNMGKKGTIFFLILAGIGFIVCKIEDKIYDKRNGKCDETKTKVEENE